MWRSWPLISQLEKQISPNSSKVNPHTTAQSFNPLLMKPARETVISLLSPEKRRRSPSLQISGVMSVLVFKCTMHFGNHLLSLLTRTPRLSTNTPPDVMMHHQDTENHAAAIGGCKQLNTSQL